MSGFHRMNSDDYTFCALVILAVAIGMSGVHKYVVAKFAIPTKGKNRK